MHPHTTKWRRPIRRLASIALPIMVVALVASACGRSVTLGYEEAIEVMVLDGVDRNRASCIVSALDGELELAKVTGLDVDLEEAELLLLAATSSRCAPALANTGGVVSGPPMTEATLAEGPAIGTDLFDVEVAVYRMVEEGLDPTLADCLIVGLSAYPEPAEAFADALRLSELVVDCRDPA